MYHHHKHQGLDPLIRSVSRVTAARANASSVFQLFSFLVVCSGMISKGYIYIVFLYFVTYIYTYQRTAEARVTCRSAKTQLTPHS